MRKIWQKIKWFFSNKYRVLSGMFVFILLASTVFSPILKNVLKTEKEELNESRELNNFVWDFNNFGNNFDKYYNDHSPLRKSFITLYNKIYGQFYKIFPKYKDPVKNELPLIKLSDEELAEIERFKNVLVEADEYFYSLGKQLVFQFAPTKNSIDAQNYVKFDYMIDYIMMNSDVKVTYAKKQYMAAEKNYKTYYQNDNHHNFMGGYICYSEMQKLIGIPATDLRNIEILEYSEDIRKNVVSPNGISSNHTRNSSLPLHMQTELIYDKEYNVKYKPGIEIEIINNHPFWSEYKSNSENKKTLFMMGNSFQHAQKQFASKDFEYLLASQWTDLSYRQDSDFRQQTMNSIARADVISITVHDYDWDYSGELGNPGVEIRLAFLMELAKLIY